MNKHCEGCGTELPNTKRAHAICCGSACRAKIWQKNNPKKKRDYNSAWRANNPEKHRHYTKTWQDSIGLEKLMYIRVKSRAKHHNIPFTLDLDEIVIPVACPVLGIILNTETSKHGASNNSPSLDRIVPSLGYVKGNVRVISNRANSLKSNATKDELKAVLWDYVKLGVP